MTLPIKMVYDLLLDSPDLTSVVDSDHIFMLDVPEDNRRVDHFPIIRINEINDKQNAFASNMPNSIQMTVQVDVWSNDYSKLDTIQSKLDSYMAANQWVQYSGSIDIDPDIDTPRLYRRYRAIQQINNNNK
ncbi:hypothetical protein GCM10028778_11760 [Barrientosiimonas marina]|uniref:DUF3168 domain-containing protein n=1 Tax=Lentibacillus kimchii TaxID=1542911 RepID=A0ABW2V0G6_9BACI